MNDVAAELIRLQDTITEQDTEIERLAAEAAHWRANCANAVALKRELLDRPDLADRAKSIQAKDARIRELEEAVDLLKMLFGRPQTAIKFEPGGALIQIALDNDGVRTLHQAQTLHPNWFTNHPPAQLVSGLPSVSPNPKEPPC